MSLTDDESLEQSRRADRVEALLRDLVEALEDHHQLMSPVLVGGPLAELTPLGEAYVPAKAYLESRP